MSSSSVHSLKIFDRWKGRQIAAVQTTSQVGAIHTLIRSGISLKNADLRDYSLGNAFLRGGDFRGANMKRTMLRGAYLRDSSLRSADLRYANMRKSVLRDADLRNANLSHVDLANADLRGANLVGAELQDASLQDARLEGAVLDWRRGTIPAEILRRSAGAPGSHPRLVLDLLVHGERDDLPWLALIGRHPDDDAAWAIGLLAPYVRTGDNAPPFLKRIVAALQGRSIPETGLPRLKWTRRSAV